MILATTAKNSKVGQDSGTFRIFLALTIVEFSTEKVGNKLYHSVSITRCVALYCPFQDS